MPDPLAEAHARADRVARLFGSAADPPITGELLDAYRRRMAEHFQPRAVDQAIRSVSLKYAPPPAFEQLERQIYDAATQFARSPASAPPGGLRAIVTPDQSGRTITEYVGDCGAWLSNFAMPVRRVVKFKCQTGLNSRLRGLQ